VPLPSHFHRVPTGDRRGTSGIRFIPGELIRFHAGFDSSKVMAKLEKNCVFSGVYRCYEVPRSSCRLGSSSLYLASLFTGLSRLFVSQYVERQPTIRNTYISIISISYWTADNDFSKENEIDFKTGDFSMAELLFRFEVRRIHPTGPRRHFVRGKSWSH